MLHSNNKKSKSVQCYLSSQKCKLKQSYTTTYISMAKANNKSSEHKLNNPPTSYAIARDVHWYNYFRKLWWYLLKLIICLS